MVFPGAWLAFYCVQSSKTSLSTIRFGDKCMAIIRKIEQCRLHHPFYFNAKRGAELVVGDNFSMQAVLSLWLSELKLVTRCSRSQSANNGC